MIKYTFFIHRLKTLDDEGLHWVGELAHNVIFRQHHIPSHHRRQINEKLKPHRKAFEKIGTKSTPNKLRKRLLIQQVRMALFLE